MGLRQTNTPILLAAVLGAAICCCANRADGEAIPVDDFNDCNDEGWTHVGHIIGDRVADLHPAPGGTWDASFMQNGSCAYRLATAEAGVSALTASWDGSVDTQYSNGFFRARVRPESQQTGIIMAMRASTEPFGDGFLGEIHLHQGIMQIRDHAFPGSLVQTNLDVQANEDWFMQVGAIGDQFSLKAWRVGDPEPVSPQLSATYSSRTTGLFDIGVGVPPGTPRGIGSAVFDDIVFFVPEPSMSVLAAIGCLGILALGRRPRNVMRGRI